MNNILDVKFFDSQNNLVNTQNVYIKGLHVGDAAKDAIAKALLPTLYPNASTQVNGVDMFYISQRSTGLL